MPLKNLFDTLPLQVKEPVKQPIKQSAIYFMGLWGITGAFCSIVYTLAAPDIYTPERLHDFARQLCFLSFVFSFFIALVIGAILHHRDNQKRWVKEINYYKSTPQKKSVEKIKNIPNPSVENQLLHILAADDNSANLLILHNYLARSPIVFLSAENGSEALKILQSQPVDIILMDIEMQGMDGVSATKIIRSIELEKASYNLSTPRKRRPIIGISAHNEKERRIEMLAAGFDDYIIKPVSKKTLFTSLQRWHDIENPMTEDNKTVTTDEQKITFPSFDEKPEKIRKVIDIQQSLEHSNNNPTLAKDILTLLVKMLHDEKKSLISYYQKQDWEALYQLNHKIYGSSSYCGTPELQKASQRLESLLHNFLSSGQILNEHSNNLSNQPPREAIDPLFSALLKAIDDIIEWETKYDINVVFGLDD